MTDYSNLPDAGAGHDAPYFPPTYGRPDCGKCEKKDCLSCGKYQRDRRDFTYTSGRCPRLPDRRGFVEQDERELYAQTFPLVHAERGAEDTLHLSLSIPGQKRLKKVYRSSGYGVWWFRDYKAPDTGHVIRRILHFDAHFANEEEILEHMESRDADYCVLPVNITDGYL